MTARRRCFFLLALGIFFVLCEKDVTGPVSPPEDDNAVHGDATLLASATVGPEGGHIAVDSLVITIPAAAFQEKTQLSVLSSSATTPLEQSTRSALYQLEGLPEQFGPIEIRLAHRGSITGDTLIAIGEKAFAKSRGDSVYSYVAHKAKIDSNSLFFTLATPTSLKKRTNHDNKTISSPIRFTALDGYTTTTSGNGHFNINHPVDMASQAMQLGQFFEAAYDTFQTMGFSYAGRTEVVQVMVADIPTDGEYAFFMPRNPTDASIRANLNKGRFSISKNILHDPKKMAVTTGHEFMHLIQNLYEFSDPYVKPEQLWLSEALAVWAESQCAGDPNYISPELIGNEVRFFLGWQHASAVHGYGMSTLLKNIADTCGDETVIKILETIRDGSVPASAVDPVDAVLSVISDPIEHFWHNTLGDYILGQNYGGTISRNLLSDPANYAYTFTIAGPDDTLKSMLFGFNDLSGALIKIELEYTEIDSAASLSVFVDDSLNCGLMLCAYKNGAINMLKNCRPGQNESVELPNVQTFTQAGQDLILLISNGRHRAPYNGVNDVNVTMRINSPDSAAPAVPGPQLVVPAAVNMGYWKYLRYCQTPYGQRDVLFSCKLSDPNADATISLFKPDSGWIYSQPISGLSSINFTGDQLATIAPDRYAGAVDSILFRVENEYGADTSVTLIHIGGFFDGVVLEDSLANWKDDLHPEWFCIDPALSGPFSGSSLFSSVRRQNYQCGVVKSLSHSTISTFNLSLADGKAAGSGSSNYKVESSQAQPAEEQWLCRYTFDNSYDAALASFDDVDYFLFMNLSDVSTSITRKEVWTHAFSPDSVWTGSENRKASLFLSFKGKIQY